MSPCCADFEPRLARSPEPRFNFAPMQRGVVVWIDKEGRREPVIMRWGLVPSWSKDDKAGAAMINAKAERVAEKPAYRSAFKSRLSVAIIAPRPSSCASGLCSVRSKRCKPPMN